MRLYEITNARLFDDISRRSFLKGAGAIGLLATVPGSGLVKDESAQVQKEIQQLIVRWTELDRNEIHDINTQLRKIAGKLGDNPELVKLKHWAKAAINHLNEGLLDDVEAELGKIIKEITDEVKKLVESGLKQFSDLPGWEKLLVLIAMVVFIVLLLYWGIGTILASDFVRAILVREAAKIGISEEQMGEIIAKHGVVSSLRYTTAGSKLIGGFRRMGFGMSKEQFQKLSRRLTEKTWKLEKKKISRYELRGLEHGYDLDHKYSVICAWENGWGWEEVANVLNLHVITSHSNRSKGRGICRI